MIRHVVLWKLSAADADQRRREAEEIRQRLERLVGVVPGLRSLAVGADTGWTEGNWDVVLVSEHDDQAALNDYQVHPAHVEVSGWIRTLVRERACVDTLL
jgi:uncharacterized protein with GYD domain